ncbi:hypothetical protein P167DRAFT_75305 [Morchella conica CCBAS932]|uniref:Uncharacterized protein n=1 Tax=Morchella conica CCBAS932 TaxID=1392247 RepID=A0A3N4KXB2_9PEZI|nr:hypothetical protein P167DRAFT_75305 [Morchella conica CCBAS932]
MVVVVVAKNLRYWNRIRSSLLHQSISVSVILTAKRLFNTSSPVLRSPSFQLHAFSIVLLNLADSVHIRRCKTKLTFSFP